MTDDLDRDLARLRDRAAPLGDLRGALIAGAVRTAPRALPRWTWAGLSGALTCGLALGAVLPASPLFEAAPEEALYVAWLEEAE